MKAYVSLVNHALHSGNTVSVWDGEEWQVKKSKHYYEIVTAIRSVEEAVLLIRDSKGLKVAHATVLPYGVGDDETVSDWVISPFMAEWDAGYQEFMAA
jgi:hypothetical protein